MKVMFLMFHGFADYSGISKKINYQVEALRQCGVDARLCKPAITPRGEHRLVCGEDVVADFGKGRSAKIRKRVSYGKLADYLIREGFDMLYARNFHNANPWLTAMLKKVRLAGIKTVMEIPTFPYDKEYGHYNLLFRSHLMVDRLFRRGMAKQVYRFVTFSDHETIFGTKTIRISNGIDFKHVPLKSHRNDSTTELHLLGVAEIHFWHGFDRVIKGLAEYYQGSHSVKVTFDVVGSGFFRDVAELHRLVAESDLDEYVRFHGSKSGVELDAYFEKADMGIASLGRHRSGITKLNALKNREYAARGIPFTYSEIDDDFENMPYVLKSPPNDQPIDIQGLVDFYFSHPFQPAEIRATIEPKLSWQAQMQKVLDETFPQ